MKIKAENLTIYGSISGVSTVLLLDYNFLSAEIKWTLLVMNLFSGGEISKEKFLLIRGINEETFEEHLKFLQEKKVVEIKEDLIELKLNPSEDFIVKLKYLKTINENEKRTLQGGNKGYFTVKKSLKEKLETGEKINANEMITYFSKMYKVSRGEDIGYEEGGATGKNRKLMKMLLGIYAIDDLRAMIRVMLNYTERWRIDLISISALWGFRDTLYKERNLEL